MLGLVEAVEFPVLLEEAVPVGLALLVLEPNPDAVLVGLVELVLEEVIVLVLDPDPVDVLLGASVLVTVNEFPLVIVNREERELELEPVDVLEGRIDNVSVGDADDVLDRGGDAVYDGVAELVLDTKADPVVVFEIVVVLLDVDELVSVFVIAEEADK